MARSANWDDLHAIVRWRGNDFAAAIQREYGFTPRQFSLPVDGRGLRVKISIKPGDVPGFQTMKSMQFILVDEPLSVPIEIHEDYEESHPLTVIAPVF